jgi:ketosteroid isomerase-like protein
MNKGRFFLALSAILILIAGKNLSPGPSASAIAVCQTKRTTDEEVIEMEKQWWEAYKNKDVNWYRDHLKPDVLFVNPSGRQTKADMVNSAARGRCEVHGFSLSDFHSITLAKDVVLLSYHATEDTTCDGQKSASKVYGTTIYAKERGRWLVAFAQETVIPE